MMNRYLEVDRKANRSRRMSGIALCCLLLMAVCIACASLTYGSYVKEEQQSLSASVAVMRVRIDSSQSSLTLNNTTVSEGDLTFSVYCTDTDDGGATEVSFTYSLSLELPSGSTFPDYLSFSLREEGSEDAVTGTAAANRIAFDRDYAFRAADDATEKAFVLTVTVTDLLSVPQTGITLTGMSIVVHAEQIQEGA